MEMKGFNSTSTRLISDLIPPKPDEFDKKSYNAKELLPEPDLNPVKDPVGLCEQTKETELSEALRQFLLQFWSSSKSGLRQQLRE